MFVYAQFLLRKNLIILRICSYRDGQNGYCIFCTKIVRGFLTDSLYQERYRFSYTLVEEIR